MTVGNERKRLNWVLDADIPGFCDTTSHRWLLKFVGRRFGDKRNARLKQKWLNALWLNAGSWALMGARCRNSARPVL